MSLLDVTLVDEIILAGFSIDTPPRCVYVLAILIIWIRSFGNKVTFWCLTHSSLSI